MNEFPEINNLQAVIAEHMTDEELARSRLMADQMLYGFCVVNGRGERVDPKTIQPWTRDESP